MNHALRVILVGGTSHVGKSTLAREFAARYGWNHLATDQFARHPGRPWRDDDLELPADVRAYYQDLSVREQLDNVLEHYRANVGPIADAVIRSHLNNPYDPGLILEGSAILPEFATKVAQAGMQLLWLTAPEEVLQSRVYAESRYGERRPAEQALIDAFLDRTIGYDRCLVERVVGSGLTLVDVAASDALSVLGSLVK